MNDLAGSDRTPLPPMKHEEGSWSWEVSSTDGSVEYPISLNIEVSAHGGGRWVSLDDGGDPIYLDEERVELLLDALKAASAIAWE